MQRLVIDCTSRTTAAVELTAEEIAAREAEMVAAESRAQARLVAESEAVADRTEASKAIANLQAYVDLTTPTAAQTTACVKLLARVAIILIRRALRA